MHNAEPLMPQLFGTCRRRPRNGVDPAVEAATNMNGRPGQVMVGRDNHHRLPSLLCCQSAERLGFTPGVVRLGHQAGHGEMIGRVVTELGDDHTGSRVEVAATIHDQNIDRTGLRQSDPRLQSLTPPTGKHQRGISVLTQLG